MSVLIETSAGDLVVDLEISSPGARLFLKSCKNKLFNNVICGKIEKGLACVFGTGKEKILFPASTKFRHDKLGTVSWVAGESFLITLRNRVEYFDKDFQPFGTVAEGLETLEKIDEIFCDNSGKPFIPLRIKHTVILEDPFPDEEGWEEPDSPQEIVDEVIDTTLESDPAILEERAKAAIQASQQVGLELMGDLPDADIRPPENVLFVCKLNPVTDDEDLKIIFSRFGNVENCEIIRDTKTGESLQYAFVEFSKQAEAEKAFIGLQNVIVDDRRIRVDFSQSVAKQWNKFRQDSRKRPRLE